MSKKKQPESEEQQPAEESPDIETPEEAEQESALEEQLSECQAELARHKDLYLRTVADLENYRKRAQREKDELGRFANEKLLREFLPIKDNLERAVEHAREQESDAKALLEGIDMTLQMLGKTLEQFGVAPITALGETFDPSRHEAMGQMESADYPPNTVVKEMQRGYFLNDRLLRPAMVMVAKEPASDTPDQNE
ncbi:MAG: nucleotide exchange factor GrpE [Desulfuromonadales bacterium]